MENNNTQLHTKDCGTFCTLADQDHHSRRTSASPTTFKWTTLTAAVNISDPAVAMTRTVPQAWFDEV